MNILITGGNGYVASSIYEPLRHKYNVTNISRDDFDLTDCIATKQWFSGKKFDMVIHTAITGGSRLRTDYADVLDNNLRMYYNLLDNRNCFDRFINIGSGAEWHQLHMPYGLSKHVINQSLLEKSGFYNIRIFAIFDENERDTRFIKTNINKYIHKEPMTIFEDKKMDFFYMQDFIKVMEYYIEHPEPPKIFNCTYNSSYSLLEIANYINTLSNYTVDINLENKTSVVDYVGTYTPIDISFTGLHNGITSVYQKLLCKI